MSNARTMPLLRRVAALSLCAAALPACGDSAAGPAPAASGRAGGSPTAGGQPGTLRGTIELQPDLGIDPARFDSVFIMVRHDPNQNAADFVHKIEHPRFPQQFEITAADAMNGGAGPAGNYQIVARLDADGDAKAGLGDVQGIASLMAEAGGPPVGLVLNQVLNGDGQPPRPSVPTISGGAGASGSAAPFAPFAGGGSAAASPEEVAAAEAGPHIDGTVEIDPAFASLAGQGRLFVSVSSAQSQGGMPIAVVPVDAPHFPAKFHITTLNIPLQVDNKAEMLAGELKIKARLSLSGNAMPAPGDVECEPQIIQVGGPDVTLHLSKRR